MAMQNCFDTWKVTYIRSEQNPKIMEQVNETQLREIAHKRVDFRRHLIVYFVVNGMLWLIWFFTGRDYMWPIWPTAGWGIGVFFHYVFEYRSSRFLSEEEEFKRLKDLAKHDKEIGR